MARQMCIPSLGTQLTLAADWAFTVVGDRRNNGLIEALQLVVDPASLKPSGVYRLGNEYYPFGLQEFITQIPEKSFDYYHNALGRVVTSVSPAREVRRVETKHLTGRAVLPKGTILTVDRIYIRKGSPDYDSVSFNAPKFYKGKRVRFFAKLADVNTMMVEE